MADNEGGRQYLLLLSYPFKEYFVVVAKVIQVKDLSVFW